MRNVNETIVDILKRDKKLRRVHLQEALNSLFTEERRVGLLMLRDIINASIGFSALALKVGKSNKTLMQMLTGTSNPTLDSISRIVSAVNEYEKFTTRTTVKKTA